MKGETFEVGDVVELTPLGIRNGLTTRKGIITGKIMQVISPRVIRVSRDGWGGPPGYYSANFWRKKPTLSQAELEAAKKL